MTFIVYHSWIIMWIGISLDMGKKEFCLGLPFGLTLAVNWSEEEEWVD